MIVPCEHMHARVWCVCVSQGWVSGATLGSWGRNTLGVTFYANTVPWDDEIPQGSQMSDSIPTTGTMEHDRCHLELVTQTRN